MPRLLKRQQVLQIRELYDAGYTIRELADAFQRHPDTISRVVNGITYTRVRETYERLPTPGTGRLREMIEQDIEKYGSAAHRFRREGRGRPNR